MPRASKRDQLVEKAAELFQQNGFRATGIDTIIAEAGIAKRTLYSHFESKEELMEAALALLDDQIFAGFTEQIRASGDIPKTQLRNIFPLIKQIVKQGGRFFGCPFLKASGEFPDLKCEMSSRARSHKERLLKFYEELFTGAGFRDAKSRALRLQILVEGSLSLYQLSEDEQWLSEGEVLAASLF